MHMVSSTVSIIVILASFSVASLLYMRQFLLAWQLLRADLDLVRARISPAVTPRLRA